MDENSIAVTNLSLLLKYAAEKHSLMCTKLFSLIT